MTKNPMLRYALALTCLWLAQAAPAESTRTYFAGVPTNAAALWAEASVQIDSVNSGSPAAEAGVQAGDRVVGVNGRRVRNRAELNLVKQVMDRDAGLQLQVLRDGQVITLALARLEKGRMGVNLTTPNLSADRVAFESFGIKPTEYLGTRQGGRPDGGVLDGLIASYAPTNPTHCHPVLVRLDAFPARAAERLHLLGQAKVAGTRAWVLGLLKTYYALVESRPADAQRHLKEAKLLKTPVDPFLDGLAAFYGQLADAPPDARGVDAKKLGVTPEYFTLCYPAPVLPLKIYDWSPVLPGLSADIARAADGLPWDPEERQMTAMRYGAPEGRPTAERYLHFMLSTLVDCQNHGGWPMRFSPLFEPDERAALLRDLKSYFATNQEDRVVCALALVAPSAVEGDTNTYRLAMTTLREAGSRELAEGNMISRYVWDYHESPERETIEAIHREVNAALGIPGIYRWLATRTPVHAELLSLGWWALEYGGLWDGSARIRLPATVDALGGAQELKPAPATR